MKQQHYAYYMDNQKKTILITEDEPAMLKILVDKLTESGFQTLQATNGNEGLQQALLHHPSLILLDVLMPQMDGMAMLNRLREDPWGKTVPVIMLTNVSADTNETLEKIVNTQPAYYFVKSNTKLEDIVEKIKDILSSPAQPEKAVA